MPESMFASILEYINTHPVDSIYKAVTAIFGIAGLVVGYLKYRQRESINRELLNTKAELKAKIGELDIREEKLERIREAIEGEEDQLWRMHEATNTAFECTEHNDNRPSIITIANLKGGVGKTTLAANLAAFFDIAAQKRVLILDLDYQGSLSSMLMSSANLTSTESRIDNLFQPDSDYTALATSKISLHPALSRTDLVPAFYSFARIENRLMLKWLIDESQNDVRFTLARILSHQEVADNYDIVLIDVPPRLTTGTINAICASTHLLVPTQLDELAAEAVTPFLGMVQNLRHLNENIKLLGVIGTLTQNKSLGANEIRVRDRLKDRLRERFHIPEPILGNTVPKRASFSHAAGEDIAYTQSEDVREVIGSLGHEVLEGLVGPQL